MAAKEFNKMSFKPYNFKTIFKVISIFFDSIMKTISCLNSVSKGAFIQIFRIFTNRANFNPKKAPSTRPSAPTRPLR